MAVDRKAGLPLGVAAALGAGLALGVTGAVGQSALTSGDELRPLYATSSDVAEGKQLADISCSNCHGADGVSTTKGVPTLAGQRRAAQREPDEIPQRRRACQCGRLLRDPRSGPSPGCAGPEI